MSDEREIQHTIKEFIIKNFIFDASKDISNTESLLGSGTIDSTGILELIGFLEQNYQLKFEDNELIGENFETIEKICTFIGKKLDARG